MSLYKKKYETFLLFLGFQLCERAALVLEAWNKIIQRKTYQSLLLQTVFVVFMKPASYQPVDPVLQSAGFSVVRLH